VMICLVLWTAPRARYQVECLAQAMSGSRVGCARARCRQPSVPPTSHSRRSVVRHVGAVFPCPVLADPLTPLLSLHASGWWETLRGLAVAKPLEALLAVASDSLLVCPKQH